MPIKYTYGSSNRLAVRLRESDGTTPDLLGTRMQMRIQAGSACITVDAVPAEMADADVEFDIASIGLGDGTYRTGIWLHDGTGWMQLHEVMLIIEGGGNGEC